ncbi:MAG TPA: O-antigen polymerase [Steroidobacteraceae bacterium]|jgi:oligosaccharide repeat unit polymerase
MRRSTLNRLLCTALGALVVWVAATLEIGPAPFVIIACAACLLICGFLYKFDYLHPTVAYLLPWLLILLFSVIPISSHARPVEEATYTVLLANMFAWMLGCISSPALSPLHRNKASTPNQSTFLTEFRGNFGPTVAVAFVILYAFAAVNVLLAGYVPLLSLVTTGDSRYWEFGVPSVYGAFLAYANALGCVAFYLYLRSGRRKYLILFLSVLVMHFAFVTRQNIATLMVEAFVIRGLLVKRFSGFTLIWSIALSLIAFSALGTLRSGNIKEIIGVQQQFNWIPTSLIWVYAYSYFNALNIDNTIAASGAPYFDGYMWQTLLPSIFRPDIDHGSYLEISSMNVSSYVYPVYIDIGKGVVLWTFIVGFLTAIAYRRAVTLRRFIDVATYSCLFFCAFLSFFTDCWLYLPVIFQLFFFWIFHMALFRPKVPKPYLPQSL